MIGAHADPVAAPPLPTGTYCQGPRFQRSLTASLPHIYSGNETTKTGRLV